MRITLTGKTRKTTHLYHCTEFDSLINILGSCAFWPSFCLEKADYLEEPQDFAFAMVCFADLINNEVETHLHKFKKDSYLCMNRNWARHNFLSSVIYYEKGTLLPTVFKHVVDIEVKKLLENGGEMDHQSQMVSLMTAFFKQYEGHYWNDKINDWSKEKTIFYTEREWRFVPIVKNKEAYFINAEDFMNKGFREAKRNELIAKGYTLKFNWDDIEEIGVKGFANCFHMIRFLRQTFRKSTFEILKKMCLIL